MATILAYTSPALGHLYPITALLLELQARGHRIAVKTLADGVPLALRLGFDATAIDPAIEDVDMRDWQARTTRSALDATMAVFGARAALELADARAAIGAHRPDAVIVDANCWGAASIADAAGLGWAAFWPYTPFLRSRDTPPFGPGFPPWPGMAGRVRNALIRPLVTGALERAMLSPLHEVRAAAGAVPVRSADEFVRRAPLMLVATAEPFEYHRTDWGASVHLIGPCEYDPPPDEPPAWLADIERPIVLVSNSTERQADTALPVTAMAALTDQPVHVVATIATGVPDVVAPSNATVTGFAAHGAILDRAVCAITHGGMGSTQKALARGVPVCAVPHGRDQFEVARRVEVARCGTRLPASRLTPDKLKQAVAGAMVMTDGATRVADGFRASGGVGHGADLIERELLG